MHNSTPHALPSDPSTKSLPRRSVNLQFLIDPSLAIIIIYLICPIHAPGVKKKVRRNIAFSSYDLIGHAPAEEPFPRGIIEYKIWKIPPWSSKLYSQFDWSLPGSRFFFIDCVVKKKIFKEKMYFTRFAPISSPLCGVNEIKISCLLTLQMPNTRFGKDWPCSSWEEDVNGRRMTTDANP